MFSSQSCHVMGGVSLVKRLAVQPKPMGGGDAMRQGACLASRGGAALVAAGRWPPVSGRTPPDRGGRL